MSDCFLRKKYIVFLAASGWVEEVKRKVKWSRSRRDDVV